MIFNSSVEVMTTSFPNYICAEVCSLGTKLVQRQVHMNHTTSLRRAAMGFIEDELASVRSEIRSIPYTELITCHPAMVQVKVSQTDYKQLTVRAQFGEEYPHTPLLIELTSKTVPEKLLEGMVKVCDQEMQKHKGKRQMLVLVRFVCDFISNNPFLVCSEELSFVRKELHREGDELKVRQKAGSVMYRAYQGRYFMDFVLTVPHEYPAKHVVLEMKGSNFPQELLQVFLGHSAELSRQCVEPPLRKKPGDPPFSPKPSLQLLANYLVVECTRRYPQEKCPLCSETALPEDPKDLITDNSHAKYVYRVYCGHLYHQDCLNTYMKTPPFTGGKKCLVCHQRIFHEKWNVPPRLAEERWAHQEAKRREIAEVADFLGFS